MRPALIALLLVAVACKGKEAPKGQRILPPPPLPVTKPESLPPMPAYPTPAGGRLAVLSAGWPNEIKGEWPAEAGVCDKPAMLQLVSQVEGIGTIVLLMLPEKDRITTYPVKIASSGLPEPPASQVGAQLFRKEGPAAFQASEGSVDVYAYGKTVSGRFAVTMRQLSSNARIRYAGAFREIPVKQLDKAYCTTADSAANTRR